MTLTKEQMELKRTQGLEATPLRGLLDLIRIVADLEERVSTLEQLQPASPHKDDK